MIKANCETICYLLISELIKLQSLSYCWMQAQSIFVDAQYNTTILSYLNKGGVSVL